MFNNYDYHIVTERTKSNMELKEDYPNKISYVIYGTKDHKFVYPFKLLLNKYVLSNLCTVVSGYLLIGDVK